MALPEHVLSAFQADSGTPTALGQAWDNGVMYGNIVVSKANSTAAWSAKIRDKISIDGVRVSRPVRATDGRFIVGGYKASDFIEGDNARRIDETIAAALRFDTAMAGIEVPVIERDDEWAAADRAAWDGADVPGKPQVCHADFLACTIYSGTLLPALTDIVPTATPHPHGYTAALVLVDGLINRAVDNAVINRWMHVPNFAQLCQRAVEYRQRLVAPGDTSALSNIERVEQLLMSEASATI
ncbi:TIGR02569 family protein [Corynebacterium lubricantis]|uniref:TIGR02569 family protein n=1 Tax=Corynebacterium lubricantis TaxID=541095 RepID=UPI0003762622|nr:TIGR02569 family protein [Corynebacterium lubricantis]